MAETRKLKREYIISLRREWLKVPIYKRTRYAVKAVRRFIQRHLKVEDVRIGGELNLRLWERGNRKPPHKVKVSAEVKEEGKERYAIVNLFGAPLRVKEEKKERKKGLIERIKEVGGAKEKGEVEPGEKGEAEEKKEKARMVVERKEELLKMQDIKKQRQPKAQKRERSKGELEMERETAIISKTYKKER